MKRMRCSSGLKKTWLMAKPCPVSSHINLQSMLKKSAATDAGARIRARSRAAGLPTGIALLRDPSLNKGSAFTLKNGRPWA